LILELKLGLIRTTKDLIFWILWIQCIFPRVLPPLSYRPHLPPYAPCLPIIHLASPNLPTSLPFLPYPKFDFDFAFHSPFLHSPLNTRTRHLPSSASQRHATDVSSLLSAFCTAAVPTCGRNLAAKVHPSEWK
jgi:hypothetical protein